MTNTDIDITIPPKALKAARRAYMKCPDLAWHDAVDAACLALLKAWPERRFRYERNGTYPVVVLPFEEPTND